MAEKHHQYPVEVVWTGNHGTGTKTYQGYGREHEVRIAGKPVIGGSSDAAFRGDGTKHNPEDLLVASLSSCHMLWYLHLAAVAGVVVTHYVDAAVGTLVDRGDEGRFTEVVLRPQVTISADSDPARAAAVHQDAHHACFIANSVNFPVRCEPRIVIESP
ncbi:OsmC family protein [Dyella caseinilytica]|uniref:OsmC family protein n=1 Tax=Dyella caseinilytica TaxID=1849581 RepID=A0ABX7GXL5_9GAMM|nr:OsmC family protein [Dyella caseinilytica]QRN54693.1 OsmC family protein [Dyella caseinilytica]GFZ96114.1 peroxiredoxin [Dyella caseinilytica]